jgi:hypothetical protein
MRNQSLDLARLEAGYLGDDCFRETRGARSGDGTSTPSLGCGHHTLVDRRVVEQALERAVAALVTLMTAVG